MVEVELVVSRVVSVLEVKEVVVLMEVVSLEVVREKVGA